MPSGAAAEGVGHASGHTGGKGADAAPSRADFGEQCVHWDARLPRQGLIDVRRGARVFKMGPQGSSAVHGWIAWPLIGSGGPGRTLGCTFGTRERTGPLYTRAQVPRSLLCALAARALQGRNSTSTGLPQAAREIAAGRAVRPRCSVALCTSTPHLVHADHGGAVYSRDGPHRAARPAAAGHAATCYATR